jgi:hypothetical protein
MLTGTHIRPLGQLQTSVPHAVPFAVQSMSFVHGSAFAGAVHDKEPASTRHDTAPTTLNFMAFSFILARSHVSLGNPPRSSRRPP